MYLYSEWSGFPRHPSGHQLSGKRRIYSRLRSDLCGRFLINGEETAICGQTLPGNGGHGLEFDRSQKGGGFFCGRPAVHGCKDRGGSRRPWNPGSQRRDKDGGSGTIGNGSGRGIRRFGRNGGASKGNEDSLIPSMGKTDQVKGEEKRHEVQDQIYCVLFYDGNF